MFSVWNPAMNGGPLMSALYGQMPQIGGLDPFAGGVPPLSRGGIERQPGMIGMQDIRIGGPPVRSQFSRGGDGQGMFRSSGSQPQPPSPPPTIGGFDPPATGPSNPFSGTGGPLPFVGSQPPQPPSPPGPQIGGFDPVARQPQGGYEPATRMVGGARRGMAAQGIRPTSNYDRGGIPMRGPVNNPHYF